MKIKLQSTVKLKVDTRQWKMMHRNLSRSGNKAVHVGWWRDIHVSGNPVAQIAQWNEEGHINSVDSAVPGSYSPPRPFMRIGFMPQVKSKIIPIAIRRIDDVAMGRITWTTFNSMLAFELQNALKQTILSWDSPPNSPYTVKLKGFNDPLINTGNMYDAVKTRVVRYGARE